MVKEKQIGHISNIDEWVKEMQNTINLLKEVGEDDSAAMEKNQVVDSDDNDSG